MVKGTGFH